MTRSSEDRHLLIMLVARLGDINDEVSRIAAQMTAILEREDQESPERQRGPS
jgi:hypothetical protein